MTTGRLLYNNPFKFSKLDHASVKHHGHGMFSLDLILDFFLAINDSFIFQLFPLSAVSVCP